jgi:hypothetical protein
MSEPSKEYLVPVEGKFIFQVEKNMRVRFNADGWVEELGAASADEPLGTKLQGRTGTARDDLYARRFYDLYSRVVLFDVHTRISDMKTGTEGIIRFKDLEEGSRLYERLNKIIEIGNEQFNMNLKPIS